MSTYPARVRTWTCAAGAAIAMTGCAVPSVPAPGGADPPDTVTLRRGTFVRQVRATGTTEAVRSATTVAPRLAGQSYNLIITRLVAGGARVRPSDVLVEFDRQDPIRAALDRRAEYLDLEQQILKKRAEQAAARAADETALTVADHDVGRARLDVEKNEFLPRIDAEKNTLVLEQATARLAQLQQALSLKARSAATDITMIEIRRDRAERAWRNAEANANETIIPAIERKKRLLALEEAKRRLAQLEEDVQSRTATNRAAMAVVEEKRTKATLASQRAQQIIDSLVVRTPIDGLVIARENRDGTNMFYSGMTLPLYRTGDLVMSGRLVLEVHASVAMEVRIKVNEQDRAVVPRPRVVAGWHGRARELFRQHTRPLRMFDVTLRLDQPDPRLRPGTSVRVVVNGAEVRDALTLPRQGVFQK